jgi:hypothetical protein
MSLGAQLDGARLVIWDESHRHLYIWYGGRMVRGFLVLEDSVRLSETWAIGAPGAESVSAEEAERAMRARIAGGGAP